jgi:hypothetical protein
VVTDEQLMLGVRSLDANDREIVMRREWEEPSTIYHLPSAMQAGIVQRPATTSAASRAKVFE